MAPLVVPSEAEFRPAKFKSKEFDLYVENLMKEWKVPGLAIAVIDGDQTVVKVLVLERIFCCKIAC